jgi:virginiamycin B lyase
MKNSTYLLSASFLFVVLLCLGSVLGLLSMSRNLLALSGESSFTNNEVSSNHIREFVIPTPDSGPNAIISASNNTFWLTEFNAGKIAEFIEGNTSFKEFSVPENGSQPDSIGVDHLGNVWFSDYSGEGSVWMFNPKTDKFTKFTPPTPNSKPLSIVADSENNIWFTEFIGNKLAELVYPNYSLKEYSLPVANADPAVLAFEPNSSLIWITEAGAGAIASFNTETFSFSQHDPPPYISLSDPVGIVADPKGDIWISEHGGSAVVEFISSNSTWRKYPTSSPPTSSGYPVSAVATIAMDKEGNIWFVEHFANRVGKLDPRTDTMEEFQIPTPGAYSVLSTLDSEGNFWFTEYDANRIGMIPNNVTSPLIVNSTTNLSVNAGERVTLPLTITNDGSIPLQIGMGASSSFTYSGETTPNEVSFNVSSITLQPGRSVTMNVSITPDPNLSPGIYSVSFVASYGNNTSIHVSFLEVSNDLYILYLVESKLPIIILGLAIIGLTSLFLIRRYRR